MRTYEELMMDEELDFEHDAQAMFDMALCYSKGLGCDVQPEKGEEWLKKAARCGHEEAKAMLEEKKQKTNKEKKNIVYTNMTRLELHALVEKGDIQAGLEFAKRGNQKAKEVFDILCQLKEHNDGDIEHLGQLQLLLGDMYAKGSGCTADKKQAFLHYSNAMELKTPGSVDRMAACYEQGIGTNRNYEKAIDIRMKFGETKDKYLAGTYYYIGKGVEKSILQALRCFDMAAQGSGVYAMMADAILAQEGEKTYYEESERISLIERKANSGNEDCLRFLMQAYTRSDILSRDMEKAMHYASLLYQNHVNSKALEKEIIELLLTCGKEGQYLEVGKQFPFYEHIVKAGITKGYPTCKQYFLDIIKQEEGPFNYLRYQLREIEEQLSPCTPQGKQCMQEIVQAIEDREAYLKAEKERIKEEERRRCQEEYEERQRQKKEAEEAERKKNRDRILLLLVGPSIILLILVIISAILSFLSSIPFIVYLLLGGLAAAFFIHQSHKK